MLLQAEQPETESPDYQAGSLLRNLARPIAWRASWGLIGTAVLTGLTFGIAPLLILPDRLRSLIAAERNRYLQLAEWMQSLVGTRAAGFTAAVNRVRPHRGITYLPSVLAGAVMVAFGIAFADHGMTREVLIGGTWGYSQLLDRASVASMLFVMWTGGLTLAYVLHFCQLLLHQARVRDAIVEFNHLIAAEGLAPVTMRSSYGMAPAWIIGGVMAAAGASALWAIPLALCGGLQRRYARRTVPVVQGQLGLRVRQLLSRRRPAMFVPTPVSQARRCTNERCRAPIARVANFCPRCGTHVGPEVNSLA